MTTTDAQKVLLTGGTGFLGGYVAERLAQSGFSIRALVRDHSDWGQLQALGVQIVTGDLLDPGTLAECVAGVHTIVHLVGIIVEQPRQGITFDRIHAEGTRHLAEAAFEAAAHRFVYVSALGAQADAPSRYHRSKAAAESAVRKSGLEYIIFRPSVIVGPEDRFVNRLADMVDRPWMPVVPVIGQGWQKVHPIAVEDVAECIVRAVRGDVNEGSYNLGGPDVLSMIQLIDAIKRVLGRRRIRMHVPVFCMRALAPVLAFIGGSDPLITPDQLRMLEQSNVADPNHALEILKNLIPLEKQLRGYLAERGRMRRNSS